MLSVSKPIHLLASAGLAVLSTANGIAMATPIAHKGSLALKRPDELAGQVVEEEHVRARAGDARVVPLRDEDRLAVVGDELLVEVLILDAEGDTFLIKDYELEEAAWINGEVIRVDGGEHISGATR